MSDAVLRYDNHHRAFLLLICCMSESSHRPIVLVNGHRKSHFGCCRQPVIRGSTELCQNMSLDLLTRVSTIDIIHKPDTGRRYAIFLIFKLLSVKEDTRCEAFHDEFYSMKLSAFRCTSANDLLCIELKGPL